MNQLQKYTSEVSNPRIPQHLWHFARWSLGKAVFRFLKADSSLWIPAHLWSMDWMDRRPETGWPKAGVPSAVPKVPGTAPLPMPPLLHGMQHRPNIHRTRVNTGPNFSEYCRASLGLMCNCRADVTGWTESLQYWLVIFCGDFGECKG